MSHRQDAHQRVFDGLFFDRPTDQWPAWARQHLAGCDDCRAEHEADGLLRLMGRLSQGMPKDTNPSSPTPAPLGAVADGLEAFPPLVMRGGGALELVDTDAGVRAFDQDASFLGVFALVGSDQQWVARTAGRDETGVGLRLPLQPGKAARLLAVSTRVNDPDITELLTMWAHDVLSRPDWVAQATRFDDPRVHVRVRGVEPSSLGSELRIQSEELAPTTPAVQRHTSAGRKAGMNYRLIDAMREYFRAAELAVDAGDVRGQVRGTCGLSHALYEMGFADDAEAILRQLIGDVTIDAQHGAMIARMMATLNLEARADLDEARRWSQLAESLVGADQPWMRPLRSTLAFEAGQFAVAIQESEDPFEELPTMTRMSLRLGRARSLMGVGRKRDAKRLLDVDSGPQPSVELSFIRMQARAEIEPERVNWASIEVQTRHLLDECEFISVRLSRMVADVARRAHRAGAEPSAAMMFRCLFLPGNVATESVPLLASVQLRDGLVISDPRDPSRLRCLGFSARRWADMVLRAEEDVRTGRSDDSLEVLANLLFPFGLPERESLLVAAHGGLEGVPMNAIVGHLAANEWRTVRHLTALRFRGIRAPESDRIVSFADAFGDLPHAAIEVREHEAGAWYRGQGVTRAALAQCGRMGLLHIGVHGYRERGLPVLGFADGPLTAGHIGQLEFEGHPVVLLSGCHTAPGRVKDGVERSLAQSFLQAGAGAVVATQWPVEDREMHAFVRALVAAWPFKDTAEAVSWVCRRLRTQGAPARLWAAPITF